MGASEPIIARNVTAEGSRKTDNPLDHLQPFVCEGADVYCLGVQECVTEAFFHDMDAALSAYGVRRIRLDSKCAGESASYHYKAVDVSAEALSSDPSKLCGRGDGSLLSLKYTGLAIFIHERLLPVTRVLAVTRRAFSPIHSKGGVAAVLSIAGSTVVFITCHLEAHKNDMRRSQIRDLISHLGSQLAEEGFHIISQFHHVIWCGDFNYRLVDPELNTPLPADLAVQMLRDGQNRKLFDTYDQLNREKRAQEIFYGFREPEPFPTFFPTYKKIENRPPVDLTDPAWVQQTYRVKFKEPFYKGGMTKERTPGYCDRVLYYSIADQAEFLVPQRVNLQLRVEYGGPELAESGRDGGGVERLGESLSHVVDNYQSVNGGVSWCISDHSPVFAQFMLHLNDKGHPCAHEPAPLLKGSAAGNDTFRQDSASRPGPPQEGGGWGSDGEANDEGVKATAAKIASSPSLLPRGQYRICLSDMKVVWGGAEEFPCSVAVLFPLPFEVINGANFADFQPEGRFSSQSRPIPSDGSSVCADEPFQDSDAADRASGRSGRQPEGWQSNRSATKSCLHLSYDSGGKEVDPLLLIW